MTALEDPARSASVPTAPPYALVSTDAHVGPSLVGQLRDYCDAVYLEDFDRYAASVSGGPVAFVGTATMFEKQQPSATTLEARRRAHDCRGQQEPYQRLADMDADGVVAEVIFAGGQNDEVLPFLSPMGLSVVGYDAELQQAGQRIFNRWLADFVTVQPERHVGLVHIPIWDVEAAVAELRWGREHGLKGVNFAAPRSGLTPYNDPSYDPFWATVQELDMPLCCHSGGGEVPLGIEGPGGAELFQSEALWFSRRALHQLIFGGVFERFPGLKVVFAEQRTAWVPQTLSDLDSIYFGTNVGPFVRALRSPSEYWAQNCYIGGSFLARFEVELRDVVGVGNLMWGTDYPHQEGTWPNTALAIRNTFHDVPEPETRAILGDNAIGVFGLDPVKLHGLAERIGPKPADVAQPLRPDEFPEWRGFAFRERGQYS